MTLSMWTVLGGVLGNYIFEASKSLLGLEVVLLVYFVILEVRLRRGLMISRAAEGLLEDGKYAVNSFLNAPQAQIAQVQADFSAWESKMDKRLEGLCRKRICTRWHVDHFNTLGTVTQVASPLGNLPLAGQIAAKAQRLKDIARDLDLRAIQVWPL